MSKERKEKAKLAYSIDTNGEIFIDIDIVDYSEATIKQFSSLLASIPETSFQVQTLAIIQEAFIKDEKTEEFTQLVQSILLNQANHMLMNEKEKEEYKQERKDSPLIKPSDII